MTGSSDRATPTAQRGTGHGARPAEQRARVRDTGRVANGILTGSTGSMAPDVARRTWPRWVALGVGMLVVAVTAVLWDAAGARLLLGAIGAFLVVRGTLLLRGARAAARSAERRVGKE